MTPNKIYLFTYIDSLLTIDKTPNAIAWGFCVLLAMHGDFYLIYRLIANKQIVLKLRYIAKFNYVF